jgi:hypothetical protein
MRPKHWFYTVPLRLRSIFRRARVEQDLDDELRYHLEMKIEENAARGMTGAEARRSAMVALGGIDLRKEQCRDARGLLWLEQLLKDLRFGARLVLARCGVQIATGLAAGLLGAFFMTRALGSLLVQVKPYDPGTFLGVLLLLLTVAFLACYGPASRATKADPLSILRAE